MPMPRSTERFLTTHTGSLPRPDDLIRTMFAALVLTALLGVLLYLAVVLLERLLSWSPSDMPVGGL